MGVNMIPSIGYMIGCYVLTRMLSLIIGKREGKESPVTIIFAAITIIVALYGMYVIFNSELDISGLNFIP